MYTASAILAALYQRERTGEGATIDMALLDTQLAMLANQASNALVGGKDPQRLGSGHPNIVPYQPFQATDQPIIIAVGNDQQFGRLAAIIGHPEWGEDPEYKTNAARVAARQKLVPMIAEIIATKSAAEWLDQLEMAGIPAGPINTISQALADPQAVHRGARINAGGGALGDVSMVGSPIRMDGERADATLPPPALGEHNNDVLRQWIDEIELDRLRAAGIVG
jgi:crotonobetainyl-CoA:carnitine CoA-transferase CaiB-like acyl-CoA transferase